MIETRFKTPNRSTPATSTPCWNAPSTTARMPKRKRATAKEPAVRAVRVFFRNRLLRTRCRYFTSPARRDGVPEDALLQMQDDARAPRRQRVGGDHGPGPAVLPAPAG